MTIFNPAHIYEKEKVLQQESYQYFSPIGTQDAIEDDLPIKNTDCNDVCAKIVHRIDTSKKYLIKLDRSGKFLNPFSVYDESRAHQTFLDTVCRTDHKFKEVSEKAFQFYVKFLATKNTGLLNNAEREAY
jgi:hypothetical protein